MSISVNRPEVAALRKRVEAAFGRPPETHNGFIALVDTIDASLHEHLSESTLERLWGYSSRGTEAISLRTLDVLSRYVGADGWSDFCTQLKATSGIESEEFGGDSVVSYGLTPGTCLRLGWMPDRIVTVEYLGERRFVVRESVNSSLQPGDSFECLQLQKGRPLFLDRFRRAHSDDETRYVAGERNGLTMIVVL